MQIERRSLYNSLRMNWLLDPSMGVEAWQVDDYRTLPIQTLFSRLLEKEITFDKSGFIAFAELLDTPEEMTDALLSDSEFDNKVQDEVYLLVFELWRRLVPEKPCLTVFCDELDYQIHSYDFGKLTNLEPLQDALANLQVVLDENADKGVDKAAIFESVSANCANDIESFLYDFIAEQIDNGNYSYASELLEGFGDYVQDVKWFNFLKARLLVFTDQESANKSIRDIVKKAASDSDLEFNLEVLAFLTQAGEKDVFLSLLKKSCPLLELEEDFQDLLAICSEYYHRLDADHEEQAIQKMLNQRLQKMSSQPISSSDPDLVNLLKIAK